MIPLEPVLGAYSPECVENVDSRNFALTAF
jgi:hypothetical protein